MKIEAPSLALGAYYYRLTSGNDVETIKLVKQ